MGTREHLRAPPRGVGTHEDSGYLGTPNLFIIIFVSIVAVMLHLERSFKCFT